jgi:hypothetical protein
MNTTNPTHAFPRLLPWVAAVPVSRGSPRGCSEAALAGLARKQGMA